MARSATAFAALFGVVALIGFCAGFGGAFITPLAQRVTAPALRGGASDSLSGIDSKSGHTSGAFAVAACGLAVVAGVLGKRHAGKTSARYTTQVILPALTWLKTGVKANELAPTQLVAKVIGGNDVLVGKDESGSIFCVANLCPHIGTPMSEGADVIGDAIVCPLHGSSWNTKSGDLIDWCPSPPIIGPLTGLVVEKKNLKIFDARTSLFGGDIEVLVDTNAKKAYEADYWKGILDAQGKNDGTYY